jgi:hypothetical protein
VLGNETGITCNFISKGNGMHHMTSSGIFEDGSRTCFYNSGFISSSGAACFSGTVCANYLYSTTNVVAGDTLFTGGNVRKLSNNQCIFFKNAAGDNEMTIAGNGSVGVGYTNPSVQLQVSGTIATGDSANGWGRLSFNTNEARFQASKDGIDPIGISFWTQASGGGFAERMRIACDGRIGIGTALPNANLSINACKTLATVSGQACISSGVNDNGCIFFGLGDANSAIRVGMYGMQSWNGSFTDYTTKFTLTKGGVGNIDWLSVNNNGVATFACQISTPTIVSNPTSTFAACITSCSTDYSMYIRNMSSGFPLSIYTVGDSNGVNDDLKAIKIARSSNDNQFLALSLIYGGYGYGYKFTPRYYNGSAYVCGTPTVIDAYGNVGINCTAPFMPLTVAGCASIDRLAINCTGFNPFGEHLQVRGCARFFAGHLRISNAGADGNYMFLTHDDVNGYLCICRTVYAGNLIISPYGGVGINTSSITGKLSVNSGINTSSATVMTLQQATNGAVKDAAGFGLAIQNGGEATNAADLIISTATGGALCERMRITSTGVACFSGTICAPRLFLNNCNSAAVLSIGNQDSTNDAGVRGLSIITDRLRFGVSPVTSTYGAIATNGTNSGITFVTYDNSWTERARIECSGITSFICQVCAASFIANGDFNIRNTLFSTTGTLNKVTWTNLYPSTYNVADIGVQLDGNYYNGAIVFRTADADNANVLVERMRMESRGATCFRNTVYSPAFCQPSGFTVYSFPINYGASFTDLSSGAYLSIGGTEPGTLNSYCAYAHGGISPRAVAANTEGMSWTCLRFVLRALSAAGDTVGTPTYLQTAGYFYTTGFYGIGSCVNISGIMDGSRGYSTVVLPWIPFSEFTGAGDVTGFGIRNVGPTTTRIGSVWIQYK